MKRISFIIFLVAFTLGNIQSQENIEEKINQIKEILNSLEIKNLNYSVRSTLNGKLNKLIVESKKIQSLLFPPFNIKNGYLQYDNGWKLQLNGKIKTTLKYVTSFHLLKSSYWVGQKINQNQFERFCFIAKKKLRMNSSEGKKAFIEWILGRKLVTSELFVVEKAQTTGKLILPELSPNIFYHIQLEKLPIEISTWKTIQEETKALKAAQKYWKKHLLFGNTQAEKKKIQTWLQVLNNRKRNLVKEQELIAKIQNFHKNAKKKSAILANGIKTFANGIKLCNDYKIAIKKQESSRYFDTFVGDLYKELTNKKNTLEKLILISKHLDKLGQQRIKAKSLQLTNILKKMLELIKEYKKLTKENGIEEYFDKQMVSLHKDVKNQIANQIIFTEIKKLEKAYQEWKVSQRIRSNINRELKAIKILQSLYPLYQKALKATSDTKRFKYVTSWIVEAEKRKVILVNEKKHFQKLEQAYIQYGKLSKIISPQEKLKKLSKLLEKLELYPKLFRTRQVAGYYSRKVNSWLKELQSKKTLLKNEIHIFVKLKKAHDSYLKTSYDSLKKEQQAIASIIEINEEYHKKLQYKQINGLFKKEIQQWVKNIKQRLVLLNKEQNIVSTFQSNYKRWKSKNWKKSKKELYTIKKVLELCHSYKNDLKKNEISNYAMKKIILAEKELDDRKVKIRKEVKYFKEIQKFYLLHNKKKYPSFAQEKKALQVLIAKCNAYKTKETNNLISNYFKEKILSWYNKLSKQKNKLLLEKKIYRSLNAQYQIWEQTSVWSNLAKEKKIIQKLLNLCDDYNQKGLRFEISNYHRAKVLSYTQSLKRRILNIKAEQTLYNQIEKTLQAYKNTTYKNYEKEGRVINNIVILCKDYQKKLSGKQISGYYKREVIKTIGAIQEKSSQIKVISKLFMTIKTTYENWDIASRWPGLAAEENTINKIFTSIKEYNNKIKLYGIQDYNKDLLEKWENKLKIRKQKLTKEEKLFQSIKTASSDLKKKQFASIVKEKRAIEMFLKACAVHKQQAGKKVITNHYRKRIKSLIRKTKNRLRKIEKEESLFEQIKRAYKFWQKNSPWASRKSEKRAIKKCTENIQLYKEYLQMKRISYYKQNEVQKIEKALKNRLLKLKKK